MPKLSIVEIVPNCPTSPLVPIPAAIGIFWYFKTIVETGPKIADANVGGIHIFQFLTIFPICNIEVPSPWATSPPQPFSLKLITANPTICAEQPTVEAPAANPLNPIIIHKAALLIGSVNAIPTTTDTIIPIAKGCNSVAYITKAPTASINLATAGPM